MRSATGVAMRALLPGPPTIPAVTVIEIVPNSAVRSSTMAKVEEAPTKISFPAKSGRV